MNGFEELKDTVIDKNLCCFCGTCIGVCPTDYIGYHIEKITRKGDNCINCNRCTKSCPGKEFDFQYFNKKIFSKVPDNIHGVYTNIYKGTTSLKNVSSGGFATTIALYLLKEKYIDGVIGVVQNNLDIKVKILKTEDDIKLAAQSKYVFIPVNKIIKELLQEKGKYLFIGLPCQIQGMRKAAHIDKRIDDSIFMYISIFCGFNLSIDATNFLVKRSGIKHNEIDSIEYRASNGNKTGFLIRSKDKNFFINKHGYTILNAFFSRERCWKCYDYTGEFADISLGDAWEINNGSRIIVRSKMAEDILNQVVVKNKIKLSPSNENDIYKTQKKIVTYKKHHFFERQKIMKYIVNNNVIEIRLKFIDSIKARLFGYFLKFGQTFIARKLLSLIPIKLLAKISENLRGKVDKLS